MKIAMIIGTRPQYIKCKPLYDYLIDRCELIVLDTNQHFDYRMSQSFCDELEIDVVNMGVKNTNELEFMSASILRIREMLSGCSPDFVIVIGDTNSSLVASLVCRRMGIPLGHIESGLRTGAFEQPEEANRIMVDCLSDIHFVSREMDAFNVRNPVYVGDMEYYFLRSFLWESKSGDHVVMTIHRKENSNIQAVESILQFCSKTKHKVDFYVHHRLRDLVESIEIPDNVSLRLPVGYFDMLNEINSCRYVISDSGGVIKLSPFFGKKCIIPLRHPAWSEVVDHGYGWVGVDVDSEFLLQKTNPNRDLYFCEDAPSKVLNAIREMICPR